MRPWTWWRPRLKEIIDEAGPEAIYGVGSPRATNEANYLFQKFFGPGWAPTSWTTRPGSLSQGLEGHGRRSSARPRLPVSRPPRAGQRAYQSPFSLTAEAQVSGFLAVLGEAGRSAQGRYGPGPGRRPHPGNAAPGLEAPRSQGERRLQTGGGQQPPDQVRPLRQPVSLRYKPGSRAPPGRRADQGLPGRQPRLDPGVDGHRPGRI